MLAFSIFASSIQKEHIIIHNLNLPRLPDILLNNVLQAQTLLWWADSESNL